VGFSPWMTAPLIAPPPGAKALPFPAFYGTAEAVP